MERICIDTLHSVLRLPLNARAARKSDGRKTVSVPAPCSLPVGGRWPACSEDGRGQITATSIGKCWHLRRQMTSAGARPSQSPAVTALPKESQGIVYWHKKWSVSVSIRSIPVFTATPQCACRPESRMVVKRFPSRHPLASPCGRGGQQRGRRRANNGNVNRKMLAPSQADDVPRAQGPLSHLR